MEEERINTMDIQELLERACNEQASDIFLVAGLPITLKIKGHQERWGEGFCKPADTQRRTTTFPLPSGAWGASG